MKIETALRYASEIARRLHEVGGIVETPGCGHRAMQIDAVWVFGSTVKGSDSPNDLDILIDMQEVGDRLHWQEVGYDKTYFRNHGLYRAKPSYYEALKWISKGMKKVSRHLAGYIDNEESLKKVMIYPRFELCPDEILKAATSGYVKEVYDDRSEADIKKMEEEDARLKEMAEGRSSPIPSRKGLSIFVAWDKQTDHRAVVCKSEKQAKKIFGGELMLILRIRDHTYPIDPEDEVVWNHPGVEFIKARYDSAPSRWVLPADEGM